jgi:uncharacterized membrane protein YjjP (DUF1212 family)
VTGPRDDPGAELHQFLLSLGSCLTAAGEAVNEVQEHLRTTAAAYGAPHARVSVLPTYLVVSLEPGRPATVEPIHQLGGALRLDQTAALFEVLRQAERGDIQPAEGSRLVRQVVEMRPRFGRLLTVLGHVGVTVGIGLVLRATGGDLVLAALFGALVGAFKLVGARWASVQMIMPVTAAFAVSTITFLLADQGWADADLRAMIAPLITFLPGAAITMAVVELSAAEMVAGASRLVTGSVQLLLLVFGIVGGAQVVGLPTADALADTSGQTLDWWAPWLGVLLLAVGNYFHQSAPRGSFGWLCVVLYAAWIAQNLGNLVFGGYLSGFVGALVLTLVAYTVERRPTGPPALVTFLPAFWMLVPGALSLTGVAEYVSDESATGAQTFLAAIASIAAIALGVLCGYPLYRSIARSFGWLRTWGGLDD